MATTNNSLRWTSSRLASSPSSRRLEKILNYYLLRVVRLVRSSIAATRDMRASSSSVAQQRRCGDATRRCARVLVVMV